MISSAVTRVLASGPCTMEVDLSHVLVLSVILAC